MSQYFNEKLESLKNVSRACQYKTKYQQAILDIEPLFSYWQGIGNNRSFPFSFITFPAIWRCGVLRNHLNSNIKSSSHTNSITTWVPASQAMPFHFSCGSNIERKTFKQYFDGERSQGLIKPSHGVNILMVNPQLIIILCQPLTTTLTKRQMKILPFSSFSDLFLSPIFYFLLIGFLHPIWELVVPSVTSVIKSLF